MPEAPAAP